MSGRWRVLPRLDSRRSRGSFAKSSNSLRAPIQWRSKRQQISGSEFLPEGARLLADAEAGELLGYELLVSRLNRLGRRAREIDEAIDRLMAAGVTIFAVKEGHRFDNQTPMGIFTRQLFASLAELDRNTIVDTTRDGLVRKARQGALMPAYARLGYEPTWTRRATRCPAPNW